jgi:NRAMP (natural resistance-associated macrophage protein)-like metal ion transporter
MTGLEHSVDMRLRTPGRWRVIGFAGPAAMVSVGYMDPGNWATGLEGGARFGYQLMWVLLLSNLMAMLLQGLAVRLGIVARLDLAQACRAHYARPVALSLWLLCEVAIIACDLAELLGSAIALNMLFGLPLLWGVAATALDVMLILMLQHYGIRKLEAVVVALVLTIGGCMALEMLLVQPNWPDLAAGFVPRLDGASLFVAIGILGATVMPHNLYLHSSLVQTRRIDLHAASQREAIRYNLMDTVLALSMAFFINAAILTLSASTFFGRGVVVSDLRQAHELLAPMLGTTLAATAFAVALLLDHYRHAGRPGGDGGVRAFAHQPAGAPPGHARTGHRAGRGGAADGGRRRRAAAAGGQPGGAEPAASICRCAADPLHKLGPHHGCIRQPGLAEAPGLGLGRADLHAQCLADGPDAGRHRCPAGCRGRGRRGIGCAVRPAGVGGVRPCGLQQRLALPTP